MEVWNFLNDIFDGLIGHRGSIHWRPCSADLTSCEFAMSGFVKESVFFRKPKRLDELKRAI